MPSLPRLRHDPFWDADGKAVRRTRLRRRIVALLAFLIAVGAVGGAALIWAIQFDVAGDLPTRLGLDPWQFVP